MNIRGFSPGGKFPRSSTMKGIPKIIAFPIVSMYGTFSYIYHKNQPNVGKYTIHGSYAFRDVFQKCIETTSESLGGGVEKVLC